MINKTLNKNKVIENLYGEETDVLLLKGYVKHFSRESLSMVTLAVSLVYIET